MITGWQLIINEYGGTLCMGIRLHTQNGCAPANIWISRFIILIATNYVFARIKLTIIKYQLTNKL